MTNIKEKEVSQREIKIVDLFCGIGGFRKGFEQTGIKTKCVLSADIDEYATAVYNYNFKENKKPTDITKLKSEDIPDHDILMAGVPCQAWSIAGKRRGFEDARGTLWYDIFRIMDFKKPKYVLLENVKGLISHNDSKSLELILETISSIGYLVDFKILNSKDFGVPQNRERIFILAIRKEFVDETKHI